MSSGIVGRKGIKTKGLESAQQRRREAALARQEAARRDLRNHARQLATGGAVRPHPSTPRSTAGDPPPTSTPPGPGAVQHLLSCANTFKLLELTHNSNLCTPLKSKAHIIAGFPLKFRGSHCCT